MLKTFILRTQNRFNLKNPLRCIVMYHFMIHKGKNKMPKNPFNAENALHHFEKELILFQPLDRLLSNIAKNSKESRFHVKNRIQIGPSVGELRFQTGKQTDRHWRQT